MGTRYDRILDLHRAFIEAQPLYFVATAAPDGRVNVSPKGLDSLRVLGPERVAWLSVTGSGNETAAHLERNDRMTLMFCAFDGRPNILRLYGHARAIYPGDAGWSGLAARFPDLPGSRQIFDMTVDLVQTSCGMAVPLMDFREQRSDLVAWAERKGGDGLARYWDEKNRESIDGFAARIPDPADA